MNSFLTSKITPVPSPKLPSLLDPIQTHPYLTPGDLVAIASLQISVWTVDGIESGWHVQYVLVLVFVVQ
jgi:hypothetical protein